MYYVADIKLVESNLQIYMTKKVSSLSIINKFMITLSELTSSHRLEP